MKVVILAGGFGTRISEESHLKPKPMIEIGEKPILWHIMKEYSACSELVTHSYENSFFGRGMEQVLGRRWRYSCLHG